MSIPSTPQTRAARIAEIKAANEARRERLATARAKPPTGGGAGGGAGGGFTPTGGGTPRIYRASDGREFETEAAMLAHEDSIAQKNRRVESAFAILPAEFKRYGFDDPEFFNQLEGLIRRDLSDAEVRLEIRKLPAYTRRFGSIKKRIDRGLSAISEAEYLALEDQYTNTMRRFGLPEAYYTKGTNRTNPTFESLIEFDVSPVELEDRLMLGQKRVMEAAPQVRDSIRQFYGDTIKDGDMLAFVVDPKNALEQIRKKVTAAEIGAGAAIAGLGTTRQRAEELGTFGVTGEAARQGFQTIAGGLTRGSQLATIYGEGPYTQEIAEAEVFGTAGAPQAGRRRRRITQQEQAAFGGQTGLAGGALARDRAGSI
jgi:hypothetical protein